MSEGQPPETADGAVRAFIGLFLLGAVLHGFDIWERESIDHAFRWWVLAVFLAVLEFAWVPIRTKLGPRFSETAASIATDARWWVAIAIVSLQISVLMPWFQRQRELPATDSHIAQMRDDAIKEAKLLQDNLNAARLDADSLRRQLAEKPRNEIGNPPIPTQKIAWDGRLLIYSGAKQASIDRVEFRGRNNSPSLVQLKDAYFISALTGERRQFRISSRVGFTDAEKLPLDQVNPLPPGAQIALIVQWEPSISVLDFFNQWGRSKLVIEYDDTSYNHVFDEGEIKDLLLSDIVGADLILATPRVTKKNSQ